MNVLRCSSRIRKSCNAAKARRPLPPFCRCCFLHRFRPSVQAGCGNMTNDAFVHHMRDALGRAGSPTAWLIPADIYESWLRCLARGLDPRAHPRDLVDTPSALAHARERHGLLRRAARVEIELSAPRDRRLRHRARPRRSGRPDPRQDERPALRGPALRRRDRARQACGPRIAAAPTGSVRRRCCASASPWSGTSTSSTGSPDSPARRRRSSRPTVASPASSTPAADRRTAHPHSSALVAIAAMQIENALLRERHRGDIVVALHASGDMLATRATGLLALDPGGAIRGANSAARAMLGPPAPLEARAFCGGICHAARRPPRRRPSARARRARHARRRAARGDDRAGARAGTGAPVRARADPPALRRRGCRRGAHRPRGGGGGAAPHPDPDPRRDGHRQGTDGPPRTRVERARRHLRAGQLRVAAGEPRRGRAVRPCRGAPSPARGAAAADGLATQADGGTLFPRRDRRHANRAAGGAAALPRRFHGSAGRWHRIQGRRAARLGDQRRARPGDRRRPLSRRSTVSFEHARSDAADAVGGAATSRRSSRICWRRSSPTSP